MSEIIMQAKSDLFFRYLFGTQENEVLRINFINSVLEDAGQPTITSAKVTNPFNIKSNKNDKETILDIKCQTERGEFVTIEMQILGADDYTQRAMYYWAKTYAAQLKSSQFYGNLKPVISIHILDFNLYKRLDSNNKVKILDDDRMHHCFGTFDMQNKDLQLSNDFQIHFIEMPKFTEQIQNGQNLKQWIDFFKNVKEGQEMILAPQPTTDIINEAIQRFREFTADDEMRMIYEAEERAERDRLSYINTAMNDGRAIGRAEGLTAGIAQGREEGLHAAKLEAARNFLAMGLSAEKVAQGTGLSLSEIEDLQ